jgi:glyoxylase-like metal-dependent hydrolase (beta-lactamase superfamily II)
MLLDGKDPVQLDPDLLAIPTPGHTRGHVVLLDRNRYLFTGDHLAWSDETGEAGKLVALRSWYSWPEQTRSMRLLLDYRFEWVLPGHGRRVHLPADDMHLKLKDCVERMSS